MNRILENSSTQRRCTKCKVVKLLTFEYYSKDKNRSYGFMYKCKECEKLRKDKRTGRNWWKQLSANKKKSRKDYSSKLEVKAYLRLLSYMRRDKRRSQLNDLTHEFIVKSLDSPCHYCSFPSDGLDRIDNNIGHVISNCVPSCKECNIARNNNFTSDEMKLLGQAIREIKIQRVNSKNLIEGTQYVNI